MQHVQKSTVLFWALAAALPVGIGSTEAIGQQAQKPLPPGVQIVGTKAGSWRSATVFTHAIWNDMLFYGGGAASDGGDPRHEVEIGVFHLREHARTRRDMAADCAAGDEKLLGLHNPRNPVITRAQFGLDQPGKGITPLSILEASGTLYMFCTSRPGDDLHPRIVVITADVEQPLQWGNYSIVIDQSLSGCLHNHGASAILNPDNSSEVLVYFAACTPPSEYRILLASVSVDKITEQSYYTLLKPYDNPVLERRNAKANYPFVRYNAAKRQYELWYSGHTHPGSRTRSCFVATSRRKDSFEPAERPVVMPSARVDRDDNAYATIPQVHGSCLFYSGRKDARGSYRGIFVVPVDDYRSCDTKGGR